MALDLTALESALAVASEPARGLSEDQRAALKDARRDARANKQPTIVARAVAAVDSEHNVEGARLALQAVIAHPESVLAYLAGAVALDRLGFLAEALAFYEQALLRTPNDPKIAALLGATALRARQPQLAEGFFRLAMRLEPTSVSHLNNLAGVLRDLGRFDDAVELLRNRLYLTPDEGVLWNTLGTVVQEQGDTETAITFLAEAARLCPNLANIHHNLGCALADLGRFSESGDALDRAFALAASPSERAEMQAARAYAHLGVGRLKDGWADYEARFDPRTREPTHMRALRTRWDTAAPLAGKHLMIVGEQGLGDEIIFMNAAREALAVAGQVTIACEVRLMPLFARSFPTARVVRHLTSTENGRMIRLVAPEHWDGVDLWMPMGDLPKAFRQTASDFPSTPGYLRADPPRVARFRAEMAQRDGLKIGIVWKSLVMTPKRARFFAPFAAWAPLLRTPGVSFHSLQYGESAEEERYAAEEWGVTLHRIEGLDLKNDLDGVAAAGCALDLVIGPSNTSTNLAAACGGDTWLLERHRFWTMLGAEGSPWYPHARVFLAGADGMWRSAFEAMAEALRARISQRADAA